MREKIIDINKIKRVQKTSDKCTILFVDNIAYILYHDKEGYIETKRTDSKDE